MRRSRKTVRVGDIVTLQSPDMGSISASCVAGTCRADLLEWPVQMPPNIRDCRFQIYTQCRYVCREALRKLELGGLDSGPRARVLTMNAEAEEEHNRREFESHLGVEVRHGMVVQLLHLGTGKFLTAAQTIAKLERDCFRISLAEGDGNSGWAVCPVFQFQQSGYPLQYQDDFYLEAAGKRGFLHISEAPDSNAVSLSIYIKETFEVNCSTSKNRLRFCAYRDYHTHAHKDQSSSLYGDDVVTITLSEHDLMLKSEISRFSSSELDCDRPEARFVSRERGRLRADAVWKIESAEVQQAGDAVVARRPYRVKHVASGLYLSLADPSQEVQDICLTSEYHSADGSTLWEFVPVNEEEESICASTPLYIRNFCSHCWLQGLNVCSTSMADSKSVCGQEMDVSQYVYMSPAVERDDTTMIDRLRNFRLQFVMVTSVISCRPEAAQKWQALREYADVLSADLGECIRLCVGGGEESALLLDGEPEAESQHLIHEMGVLQAIVDLIKCLTEPFQLSDDSEEHAPDLDLPEVPQNVLRLAYWLVKQACKDRQEVKSFLGSYVDLFTSHVPLNVLASAALRELFKDNRRLLMDMPAEAMGLMTDRLIRSYVQSPSPENLCIFESICMCEGAPVPMIQRRVTENLLQRHGDALPMLRVQPPELHLVGPGRDEGGGLEVDPRQFAARAISQDEASMGPEELVYCLSLRSLELFAALAAGRNKLAATSLQRPPWNLSRTSLVNIVRDATCPSALRRACLAVLEKLYIDHGDFKAVPAINYTRVWREAVRRSQAGGEATEESERKDSSDAHETRQDTICPTLSGKFPVAVGKENVVKEPPKEKEPKEPASPTSSAALTGPVRAGWKEAAGRLAMLKHTSRTANVFRKVAKVEISDMDSMVSELHNILEGVIDMMEDDCLPLVSRVNNSKPQETVGSVGQQEASLHAFTSAGSHVEDVHFAIALLECISFLANFGLLRLTDPREQMLVKCITDTLIRFLSLPVTSRPMQHCKISACKLLQRIFMLQTDYRLTRSFEAYEHHHSTSRIWNMVFPQLYKDLFETPIISEQVMISNMRAFVDSLLYTISSGVELDVKSQCWNLLFLHTGQRAHLIREAKKVTVLAEPEAVSIYHKVVDAVEELVALLPDIVLSREDHIHSANGRACALISELARLCVPSTGANAADGDVAASAGGYAPDVVQKHQNVLQDLGAQRCLLQILRLPLRRRKVKDSLDEPLDPHRRDLFRECYNFLRLFVQKNNQNQEMMFPHISLFMSHIGVEHLDVGGAVAAIVQDNSVLISQMRDSDLRVFVQAIARYGKRARWLHILQSMLRVRGQWVRRNQNVVLGLLLEEQDLVLELDGHEEGAVAQMPTDEGNAGSGGGRDRSILLREGNMTRLELMAARDQDRGASSFLLYHVTCLNTLAYCCAGRNQSNQSKCRGLLSVEEVIGSITGCHKDEETGLPHDGIDADTVRFVRDPWLRFLHHCFVDATPHELFSRPEDLWGEGESSLTGVLLAEALSLAELLDKRDVEVPKEQLEFMFGTVLPLYASLVKGFGPTPLPAPALLFVQAVGRCCKHLRGHWKAESHLENTKAFFAVFSVLDGMENEAHAALDHVDEGSNFSRMASFISENGQMESVVFRDGFGKFVEGLAWAIGVNPAEVLGNGLRDLVNIVRGKEVLLSHLAEVIVQVADGPPESTPFLLNLIRAVRGYLCGIQTADSSEGNDANWQAFVNNKVPSDPDLTRRQTVAANNNLIGALAGVITHSNTRIVREVLLTLQVVFARESAEAEGGEAEAALVRYVSNESQRRHFVSACVELIRKSVADLKEREQHLQTKLEQRLAKRRALRRHWSAAGSDITSGAGGRTSDDGASEESSGENADLEDCEVDPSNSAAPVESGHALELLTVLTYCLQGGRRELQDMLFVASTAKMKNYEDLLVELVKYLALTEKLLSTSLAHGHKSPLHVLHQAFCFLQQLIRGPNSHAVEALVCHTDIVVIVRHCLKHIRCGGSAAALKLELRGQILMFTLDMLQNLTSSQVGIARKWISQECDKAFLQAWQETHDLCVSNSKLEDEGLSRQELMKQRFLSYAVLSYLADTGHGNTVWREMATNSQAIEACSQQCGRVEVLRDGEVVLLRFRVPGICERLRSQEGFRAKIEKIVYDCVGEKENERARVGLFQDRVNSLIMKEVRHFELVGNGFLGVLVSYQNWVRRLPIVATVLMNLWLICFEAMLLRDAITTDGAQARNSSEEGSAETCAADDGVCTVTPGPPVAPFGALASHATRFLRVLLSFFHLVCYLLRFVLVIGTSTHRREFMMEAVLLFFSLVGTLLSPFFFVIHMLEFFGAQSARMLLSAATLNLTKLGQAGLIIVLTVYLYAVVGFQLFKDKHTEGKCTTLLNCAISYLDGGLTGNGIHEALELKTPNSLWGTPVAEWLLQLFAMSFLTIHVQVLLAIFSGIIIDSFGELRDRHAEITSHLSEQDHLLSESVFYQYVDFLVFLYVSESSALSDLEKYLAEQVRNGSSEWLPYRLTLELQVGGGQAAPGPDMRQEGLNESMREQMRGYNEQLEELRQRLENIDRRLTVPLPSFVDERSPEAASPARHPRASQQERQNAQSASRSSAVAAATSRCSTPGLMERRSSRQEDRMPASLGRAKLERGAEERLSSMEEQLFCIRQMLEELTSQQPPARQNRVLSENWDQGLTFF